jgi:hypothetical protein
MTDQDPLAQLEPTSSSESSPTFPPSVPGGPVNVPVLSPNLPAGVVSLGSLIELGSAYPGVVVDGLLNVTFGFSSMRVTQVIFSGSLADWVTATDPLPAIFTAGKGELKYVLSVPISASPKVYQGQVIVKGVDPFYNSISASAPIVFVVLGEEDYSSNLGFDTINLWLYVVICFVLVLIVAGILFYRHR